MRKRKMYLSVEDIAELFGLSVSFAYRVVERMNADLASKNYYVILGRVPTRYVEDKIYGLEHVEQYLKAPYIWPASFCNTSRQSCSHGFQRLSPVPLDGAAGHSHHRADLAVRQFQDTMQYQDALSRLGQAGKGSGHQPVADLKLTAIGRKYKTVAGVLIYRA